MAVENMIGCPGAGLHYTALLASIVSSALKCAFLLCRPAVYTTLRLELCGLPIGALQQPTGGGGEGLEQRRRWGRPVGGAPGRWAAPR